MRISKGKSGRNPRTVYFEIAIWQEGNLIHIGHNENEGPSTLHTTVGPDGSKPNGHPKLYEELAKILANLPS